MQELATLENFLLFVGIAIIGYLFYTRTNSFSGSIYANPMHYKKEMMGSPRSFEHLENTETPAPDEITLAAESTATLPAENPITNELLPVDLLPNYDEATSVKGNAVTETLKAQNFIIGSFPQGLDTVATSKRIPYFDIRNNYPVPKEEYPWNNSPYDEAPGSGRKFFDIGA